MGYCCLRPGRVCMGPCINEDPYLLTLCKISVLLGIINLTLLLALYPLCICGTLTPPLTLKLDILKLVTQLLEPLRPLLSPSVGRDTLDVMCGGNIPCRDTTLEKRRV